MPDEAPASLCGAGERSTRRPPRGEDISPFRPERVSHQPTYPG
jgi:hypothetical protein